MRMRGLRAGEQWEAVWGPNPEDSVPEECYIWIRFLGATAAAKPAVALVKAVDGVEYAW